MDSEALTNELTARLDTIAAEYDPSNPAEQFDYWLKRLQVEALIPWLRGDRVLELGCATGELTSLIAPITREYSVVEGSAANIETARRRVPAATFTHALWSDFEPEGHFSDIIAFNAIEHADQPVPLLRQIAGWTAPQGRVHVVVPNGNSLHRLVGVELGLQTDPLQLTDGDVRQGHERNYTIDSLISDLRAAGLNPIHWEPIFLKLLPNREMLEWSWERIGAVQRVASRVPEHGAELYVVAEPL